MDDPSIADRGVGKKQGALYWISALFASSIDAQCRAVDDYMKLHLPGGYQRFQVSLDCAYAIDDVSEETLKALIENCRQFIHDHSDDIDNMVAALKKNRGYI